MSGPLYDTFYETFIGRCARCRVAIIFTHATANSFGVLLEPCQQLETDESLRERIGLRDGVFGRMVCGGRVHKVNNHEAALAAYKLGGREALFAMAEEGQL